MEPIHLVILGDPKAQKRHRHHSVGKFVQTYDPSKKEKQDLLVVIQRQAPSEPLDEPLEVTIGLYFSRPKGHYGSGRNSNVLKPSSPTHHTSKPDVDNLVKLVFDAMNKVFWRDDSVICSLHVHKEYSGRPRTEITIVKINEVDRLL